MKRLIFVVFVEMLAIAALLVVALDVRLHHKFEMLGGLNIKGYRGRVMPAKRPDELRIAVVGGSFAFGWGVAAPETFSGYLGRLVSESLRNRKSPPTHATDVNLAGQGITVEEQVERIRRFAYLKPDVIVFVPDRYEVRGKPAAGMPERSGVYALTGYMPILPVILREKGQLLKADGRARFEHALGSALFATGEWLDAADSGLEAWAAAPPTAAKPLRQVFRDAWTAAFETAGHYVAVAPPRRSGAGPFAGDDIVGVGILEPDDRHEIAHVDLDALAGLDRDTLWLNGMNLGAGGSSLAAGAVVPTILDLVAR